MATIEQLGAGIGDRISFSAREHLPFPLTIEEARNQHPQIINQEAEIVGLAEGVVYVHPWTERLSAFTIVQNTLTGEFYPVSAAIVDGQLQELPLEEGERLVLALNRLSDTFSLPSPQEKP